METAAENDDFALGLSERERQHLAVLARHRQQCGRGSWRMTNIKVSAPAPPSLLSLRDKGFARVSDRMVCGPLRVREECWGAIVTNRGEIAARLLGLIEGPSRR